MLVFSLAKAGLFLVVLKVMVKSFILFFLLFFGVGCKSLIIPEEYSYKEIQTDDFVIASWQKIRNPNGKFKVYIEGDGASFDAYGRPTDNPTPKGTLLREIAFLDNNPNVIYLARPCQYVMGGICSQRHWTSARFAREVVNAEYEAIKRIVKNNDVVLVGFSGGAQVAGLLSVAKKGLNVKKLVSIGGNLNHEAWSDWHNLAKLDESLNLADYREEYLKIPQIHFVGTKDKVVPKELTYEFLEGKQEYIVEVVATHTAGWDEVYPLIWQE